MEGRGASRGFFLVRAGGCERDHRGGVRRFTRSWGLAEYSLLLPAGVVSGEEVSGGRTRETSPLCSVPSTGGSRMKKTLVTLGLAAAVVSSLFAGSPARAA